MIECSEFMDNCLILCSLAKKLVNEPFPWYYNIAPSIIYGSATVHEIHASHRTSSGRNDSVSLLVSCSKTRTNSKYR